MSRPRYEDDPTLQALWQQWLLALDKWTNLGAEVRSLNHNLVRGESGSPTALEALHAGLHQAYERWQSLDHRYLAARAEYLQARDRDPEVSVAPMSS